MKLTKLQRHTAYIIMLSEAEERIRKGRVSEPHPATYGFCYMVLRLFDWCSDELTVQEIMLMNLPELEKFQSHRCLYWFTIDNNGWRERIAVLKQCVEETA